MLTLALINSDDAVGEIVKPSADQTTAMALSLALAYPAPALFKTRRSVMTITATFTIFGHKRHEVVTLRPRAA